MQKLTRLCSRLNLDQLYPVLFYKKQINAVDDIKPNFNQLRPYEEKYFLRYIPLADQI